ncbi:MAG: peptidoglycan bridge formation glycyltransferase FemA/FemB family protein [Patescibacteria group bacterium]
MDVREITDQGALDRFVGSQRRTQFLQSWRWGEFQRAVMNGVRRFGVYDQDALLGTAQVIVMVLPLGKQYWYVPRGPVINEQLPIGQFQKAWKAIVGEIFRSAEAADALFVKLEPPIQKQSMRVFQNLVGSYEVQSAHFVQPKDNWCLDLTVSEEALMSSMHQKWRYNIRLAERKGVQVRSTEGVGDFEEFWNILSATSARDQFNPHSRSYYREMFRSLIPSRLMKLYTAERKGTVLAMNLVAFFGDTVTYVHGASSDADRSLMAPHLLQWRQVLDAKEWGAACYDFGGIGPEQGDEKVERAWSGITHFKKGFGGHVVSYIGAYDLILSKAWYTVYRLAHRVRNV